MRTQAAETGSSYMRYFVAATDCHEVAQANSHGLQPLSLPTSFVAEVGRLPKNRLNAGRNRNLAGRQTRSRRNSSEFRYGKSRYQARKNVGNDKGRNPRLHDRATPWLMTSAVTDPALGDCSLLIRDNPLPGRLARCPGRAQSDML